MKQSEVIKLYQDLTKVKGLAGLELNYAVKKNLSLLAPDIKIFTEQELEITADLAEYSKRKTKIQEEFALDENGQIKVEGDNYVIEPHKLPALYKKVTELNEEYKDTLKSVDDRMLELKNFRAETESDFKPIMIKKEWLPKDITTENMELLFDLITD